MPSDERPQDAVAETEKPAQAAETQTEKQTAQPPTAPAAMAAGNRKRPRLDLNSESRERKRGKSMFGLLVGTLNKAKNEDKERNATEAAKKRQLIDQRLQDKLKKETDSVRRAEEAKKEKQVSNRKEEELQLKDSIYKLRRTRLPVLANFLLTSDTIPTDEDAAASKSVNPLASAPRSHPPPLYYLPVILTPAQEVFINRRKAEIQEAVETEWQTFRDERTLGIEEINQLRLRVAEEDSRRKVENKEDEVDQEPPPAQRTVSSTDAKSNTKQDTGDEAQMEVDEPTKVQSKDEPVATAPTTTNATTEPERREEQSTAMQADEDDAVEY